MNYLSLPTAKTLKEWGCDIESDYSWEQNIAGTHDAKNKNGETIVSEYVIECDGGFCLVYRDNRHLVELANTLTYDLRDIICNGEMAKQFFGEERSNILKDNDYIRITTIIKNYLSIGDQEKAEERLLEYCVWNPKNNLTK